MTTKNLTELLKELSENGINGKIREINGTDNEIKDILTIKTMDYMCSITYVHDTYAIMIIDYKGNLIEASKYSDISDVISLVYNYFVQNKPNNIEENPNSSIN